MNITKIEMSNIKGIGNRVFNFELLPNRPNILVAPNGFGKSSFAIGFDSLKSNKIELDEKHYYLNSDVNRPRLSLSLTTGAVLVADDSQNTISDVFDVFVIKNQTEPKSTVQSFGGRAFAKTSLNILPTVLVQTVPPKMEFAYSSTNIKATFGNNGNRVLNNITAIFSCCNLFHRIEAEIDFTRFGLRAYSLKIEGFIAEINSQQGTGSSIKSWIQTNIIAGLKALDELRKLAEMIQSFGLQDASNEVDAYLAAWQIVQVKNTMGANFKKACKYLFFLGDKEDYTKTIEALNPIKDRFDIKPKVDGNSLVVKWPKAHELSNGQRDILTFIALLLKARRNLIKTDCILIIDEIFDYLDDGNLITFQYYISNFIDVMKRQKKRIFPVLLTHLDPRYFNHFCFNDTRINVHYLKDLNVKANRNILKLIYNREDVSIKSNVDAYYFHYHPNIVGVDLTNDFRSLKLNVDWAKPEKFLQKIFREVRRYLYETDAFDPLAICFGVRIKIEEKVYNLIHDIENKRKYVEDINGTKNKLSFAQSIDVHIPETYYLLGIIYNTSLHLCEGQDISKPLGIKLDNGTIKQMIADLFK